MRTREQDEARAIARLIGQIDEIDRWRDRVGRRVLLLFLVTFAFAVGLLLWTVSDTRNNPPSNLEHPGPRVPPVLKRLM